MPAEIYKIIHLAGIMGLFAAIGGLIYQAKDSKCKANAVIHGIAMFLILLGGFGLLAKLHNNQFEGWVIAKLVIWILFGAMLPLTKRKVLSPPQALLGSLILGIAAVTIGTFKPF